MFDSSIPWKAPLCGLLLCALGLPVTAGQLSATRLIYKEGAKDASITYTNTSKHCVGLYVWTAQTLDSRPETAVSPIAFLHPPKMGIKPRSSQTLRLRYMEEIPEGRESLYWLNTYEVLVPEHLCNDALQAEKRRTPEDEVGHTPSEARIEVPIRTRIKIFVRPASLKGTPAAVSASLAWSLTQREGKSVLTVHNPTGFHFTFSEVALKVGSNRIGQVARSKGGMVAPFSDAVFELDAVAPAGDKVVANVINDQGGSPEQEWTL